MDGQEQLQYLNGLQSSEKFLVESIACREAECQYQELQAQNELGGSYEASNPGRNPKDEATPKSSLACEIANVREKIKTFLKNGDIRSPEILCETLGERMREYTQQHEELKSTLAKTTGTLNALAEKFENLLTQLGKLPIKITMQPDGEIQCISKANATSDQVKASPAKKEVKTSAKSEPDDDDDDVDLFGSDEETEEEAKLKAERLKAYENKKAKKPALVAKSSVVLDVKPWDDETDMKELEAAVRKVETDGLKWGAGKLVPLAYGIQKFQIVAIVEDDKVSIDWLQETIQEIEDLVQSVDIAAFNKL